jgi:hypothetical protein
VSIAVDFSQWFYFKYQIGFSQNRIILAEANLKYFLFILWLKPKAIKTIAKTWN